MIIEQHYDDEVLIELLDEAEEDTHVPACDTCSGTLESYRDLSAALHDNSVWDERELSDAPSPQTTNVLRAFADRTRAEDIAAGPIVAKLIADPSAIDQHPEWRTAGVVRGLVKYVQSKSFSEPRVAADLALLAVKVADSLEPTLYPRGTVKKLRASAWHELGYELYRVGSFVESLDALDAAETFLQECAVSDYETADIALHRAQVYLDFERFVEGLELVDRARRTYCQFGNQARVAAADATKAALLMAARRFDEALPIQETIAADTTLDQFSRALAVYHAAICHRELLRFASAKDLLIRAMTQFEALGQVAQWAKARWSLGRILAAEQRFADALGIFNKVRTDFADLGMAQDVALVSVDVAEALIMLDRTAEVVELCQNAIEYFTTAGLAYTQGALTALAYLKEAAITKTLTAGDLKQVRAFFELLPKQPHLLFASPL